MQGSSLRTGENVAEIRVNLVDKQHRSESSIMLVRELRTKVDAIRARYPGAQVRLVEDPPGDRQSVVSGKSVSVRVDLGGRRFIKKKITDNKSDRKDNQQTQPNK